MSSQKEPGSSNSSNPALLSPTNQLLWPSISHNEVFIPTTSIPAPQQPYLESKESLYQTDFYPMNHHAQRSASLQTTNSIPFRVPSVVSFINHTNPNDSTLEPWKESFEPDLSPISGLVSEEVSESQKEVEGSTPQNVGGLDGTSEVNHPKMMGFTYAALAPNHEDMPVLTPCYREYPEKFGSKPRDGDMPNTTGPVEHESSSALQDDSKEHDDDVTGQNGLGEAELLPLSDAPSTNSSADLYESEEQGGQDRTTVPLGSSYEPKSRGLEKAPHNVCITSFQVRPIMQPRLVDPSKSIRMMYPVKLLIRRKEEGSSSNGTPQGVMNVTPQVKHSKMAKFGYAPRSDKITQLAPNIPILHPRLPKYSEFGPKPLNGDMPNIIRPATRETSWAPRNGSEDLTGQVTSDQSKPLSPAPPCDETSRPEPSTSSLIHQHWYSEQDQQPEPESDRSTLFTFPDSVHELKRARLEMATPMGSSSTQSQLLVQEDLVLIQNFPPSAPCRTSLNLSQERFHIPQSLYQTSSHPQDVSPSPTAQPQLTTPELLPNQTEIEKWDMARDIYQTVRAKRNVDLREEIELDKIPEVPPPTTPTKPKTLESSIFSQRKSSKKKSIRRFTNTHKMKITVPNPGFPMTIQRAESLLDAPITQNPPNFKEIAENMKDWLEAKNISYTKFANCILKCSETEFTEILGDFEQRDCMKHYTRMHNWLGLDEGVRNRIMEFMKVKKERSGSPQAAPKDDKTMTIRQIMMAFNMEKDGNKENIMETEQDPEPSEAFQDALRSLNAPLDRNSGLDNEIVVRSIRRWLDATNTTEDLFANRILNYPQSDFARILLKPADYDKLDKDGRKIYVKMCNFLKLNDSDRMEVRELAIEYEDQRKSDEEPRELTIPEKHCLVKICRIEAQPSEETKKEIAIRMGAPVQRINKWFSYMKY